MMSALDAMIDGLPVGLERAMLRLLSFHQGREKAIGREALVLELARLGFRVSEREARLQINLLRKAGHPICSTGGTDGGYWLAADWNELQEYIDREIHSRAMDLLEQEQALRAEAERRWGRYSAAQQASFF
jgi:hypothetical protein